MNQRLFLHNTFRERGINVTWDGTPIDNPRIYRVRFGNTGKQPIKREDFDGRPLRIMLNRTDLSESEPTMVLACEVADTQPPSLEVNAVLAADDAPDWGDVETIAIDPLLMNPGDWFEIIFIADSVSKTVTIDGRIAGVKKLQDHDKVLGPGGILSFALVGCVMLGALGAVIHGIVTADTAREALELLALIVAFAGIIFAYNLYDKWSRSRDRRKF